MALTSTGKVAARRAQGNEAAEGMGADDDGLLDLEVIEAGPDGADVVAGQ